MTSIFREQARVDDCMAIGRMLAHLPDADGVRSSIEASREFLDHIWDFETSSDCWFESDGAIVVCFTVFGICVQEASAMRRWWRSIRQQSPGIHVDRDSLISIVEGVTGARILPAYLNLARRIASRKVLPG